jgi:hypothetical protein
MIMPDTVPTHNICLPINRWIPIKKDIRSQAQYRVEYTSTLTRLRHLKPIKQGLHPTHTYNMETKVLQTMEPSTPITRTALPARIMFKYMV